MKKVAIVQSNYIPWKGYFDMIAAVDEFILYDDVQYTTRDWRNRNLIKTPQGLLWLTIPIKNGTGRRIYDAVTNTSLWREKHWKILYANYRRSPYFEEIGHLLKPLYLQQNEENLSTINRFFLESICDFLGIKTTIKYSCDYRLSSGKTERLVHLCKQAEATEYISGPAAKSYLDENAFKAEGIKVTWFDYSGYPEYPQIWGDFQHGVSIVDLLFNCGKNAPAYMKYVIK